MSTPALTDPSRPSSGLGWAVGLLLASGVALASVRYLAGGELMIPPPLKPNFMDHPIGFYVHIAAASTALFIGPWQFFARLRLAAPRVHRALGKVYVAACFVGGTAALTIAPESNGGWVAASGFGCLAVLWLWTTGMAVVAVRAGRIADHRRWMRRSFALTLAGVTLRLYLPLAFIGLAPFSTVYAGIAWLCWVPNLLLADRFGRSDSTASIAAR